MAIIVAMAIATTVERDETWWRGPHGVKSIVDSSLDRVVDGDLVGGGMRCSSGCGLAEFCSSMYSDKWVRVTVPSASLSPLFFSFSTVPSLHA